MRIFLAALSLAVVPAIAHAQQSTPVEVRRAVDRGKPGDIIMVGAKVKLPKGGADGFVSIRSAPQTSGPEKDRLKDGAYVIALERSKDWQAVVYLDPAQTTDDMEKACGLPNPAPTGYPSRKTYDGPCRSGWISRRFLTILAD